MKKILILPLLCAFPLIGCSFVQEQQAHEEKTVSVEEFLQSPVLSGAATPGWKASESMVLSQDGTSQLEKSGIRDIWIEDIPDEKDPESAILENTTDADVEKLVDSLFDSSDF